jgi:hypothetical protein
VKLLNPICLVLDVLANRKFLERIRVHVPAQPYQNSMIQRTRYRKLNDNQEKLANVTNLSEAYRIYLSPSESELQP